MNFSARWNLRNMAAKLNRWCNTVDMQSAKNLKEYGVEAVKNMMRCTPPANKKTSPAKAFKKLRERIRQDFEGEGEEPFQEEDIQWITIGGGNRIALVKTGRTGKRGAILRGRASPFRVFRGAVSAKKLAALNVGRFGVEYAAGSLNAFMRAHPGNYYYREKNGVWRLRWQNTRHVAAQAAVKREIRRRQKRIGTLMAGWKPLARKSGATLPAQVEKQSGHGSVEIRKSSAHKATMTAHNKGNCPELQSLVDRQLPHLRKRLKSITRRNTKKLGKKLK